MSESLQELGDRVAKAINWARTPNKHRKEWYAPVPNRSYPEVRNNPSDITEWPRLMCEFSIDVEFYDYFVRISTYDALGNFTQLDIKHDNTPPGQLNAACEAVLRAVLALYAAPPESKEPCHDNRP